MSHSAATTADPAPRGSRLLRGELAVLAACWMLLLATRLGGPSDLYDKEQPRTVSYTADMLINGHWLLPYDTFAIPATKPPLYNWLSVPFVAAFGFVEWALKAPSILGSLGVIAVLLLYGRWRQKGLGTDGESATRAPPLLVAVLAATLWLTSPMTSRLLYLARPDMVLTALLCGAWLAATILLESPARSRAGRTAAAAYWLCVTAATLVKGPPVLFALAYLVLASRLLYGRWALLQRSYWWWGLPFFLAITGAWLLAAYRQEPEFVTAVLFGREMASRATDPLQTLTTFFHGPAYLVARFLPWSLAALALLITLPLRRWFRHPAAPAILWLLIVFVGFSFVGSKRADRYAPVFPPLALLAAYYLLTVAPRQWPHGWMRRLDARAWGLVALVMIAGHGLYICFYSGAATTRHGEHVRQFARAVQAAAGADPILFLDGQLTPLQTLLGRNQPGDPSRPEPPESLQRAARWCVRFHTPDSDPLVISDPLAEVDGNGPGRLALYRLAPGAGVEAYRQALQVPVYAGGRRLPSPLPTDDPARWLQRFRRHTADPLPATAPAKPAPGQPTP